MDRHVACSVRAVAAPVRVFYMVLSVFCLGQNTVIFWSSGTVCELNVLGLGTEYLLDISRRGLADCQTFLGMNEKNLSNC